jgi:hypothetical protein
VSGQEYVTEIGYPSADIGPGGALDRFRRTRTIPAAGSGSPSPFPVSSPPARGYALVSLPRTGLVSQRPGGHR